MAIMTKKTTIFCLSKDTFKGVIFLQRQYPDRLSEAQSLSDTPRHSGGEQFLIPPKGQFVVGTQLILLKSSYYVKNQKFNGKIP